MTENEPMFGTPVHGKRTSIASYCVPCERWIENKYVNGDGNIHWWSGSYFVCGVKEQRIREYDKILTNPIAAKPIEVNEILKERGNRYAAFIDNAKVSQALKAEMWSSENWSGGKLNADQKEALELIALKISRILTGDPDYVDSWIDIAGYAQLVVDRLVEDGDRNK